MKGRNLVSCVAKAWPFVSQLGLRKKVSIALSPLAAGFSLLCQCSRTGYRRLFRYLELLFYCSEDLKR